MDSESQFIVVGSGIAGLIAAKTLLDKGIPFVGLTRAEELGGRVRTGHQRIYSERSLEFLAKHHIELKSEKVGDAAVERKKNEWKPLADDIEDEEKFLLRENFYEATELGKRGLENLIGQVGAYFKRRKDVEKIYPERKTIVCTDESEFQYKAILWCTDLRLLSRVWEGDKAALLKSLKGLKSTRGGLNLELEVTLDTPLFPSRNTVILPFRYKDLKLRALGTAEGNRLHWFVFLDESLCEDREEVAKVVRALKRELQREFPELKNAKGERLVYLPTALAGRPVTSKSLNVLPDVTYLGPQIMLPDTPEDSENLDRTLENCRQWEISLQG